MRCNKCGRIVSFAAGKQRPGDPLLVEEGRR